LPQLSGPLVARPRFRSDPAKKGRVKAMRAFLWVAVLVLIGCTPPPTPQDTVGVVTTGQGGPPPDAQACAARGGTMQRICLRGELTCVETYKDAGKPCKDKTDCTATCRYRGPSRPVGSEVVGECQRTSDPCGCFATVKNGKLEGTLCVD
jgi:hypothetical protein